jgi:hypothetical protein
LAQRVHATAQLLAARQPFDDRLDLGIRPRRGRRRQDNANGNERLLRLIGPVVWLFGGSGGADSAPVTGLALEAIVRKRGETIAGRAIA